MIILSQQIIAIIYQRTFRLSVHTANRICLSVYLLGIQFSASMIISPFYAMQNTVLPMVVNTLIALLSIPFMFFSVAGWEGLNRLCHNSGCYISVYCSLCIWNCRYAKWNTVAKLVFSISKILLITSLGCAIGYLLKQWSLGINIPNLLLKNLTVCFICAVPSFLLIIICYELTGIQRFADMISKIMKRS